MISMLTDPMRAELRSALSLGVAPARLAARTGFDESIITALLDDPDRAAATGLRRLSDIGLSVEEIARYTGHALSAVRALLAERDTLALNAVVPGAVRLRRDGVLPSDGSIRRLAIASRRNRVAAARAAGHSFREIAEMVGVTMHTAWLDYRAVLSERRGEEYNRRVRCTTRVRIDDSTIIQAYLAGCTITQICQAHHITPARASRVLHTAGVAVSRSRRVTRASTGGG
jgi:hypothetical protein